MELIPKQIKGSQEAARSCRRSVKQTDLTVQPSGCLVSLHRFKPLRHSCLVNITFSNIEINLHLAQTLCVCVPYDCWNTQLSLPCTAMTASSCNTESVPSPPVTQELSDQRNYLILSHSCHTRWFKYDRDLCGLLTHNSVPVILAYFPYFWKKWK
jgi:hypothetical protein